MRYFNVAGVCLPELHYMLPPEPRLLGVRELLTQRAWFVVHAPRQTGKTTSLRALCHIPWSRPGSASSWPAPPTWIPW